MAEKKKGREKPKSGDTPKENVRRAGKAAAASRKGDRPRNER